MKRDQDMSSSLYRSKKRINTHQLGEIELQCLHKHVDEGKKGERILEWKQYPTIDLTAVDIRCNHVHQIVYELVNTSVSPMLEHIAVPYTVG